VVAFITEQRTPGSTRCSAARRWAAGTAAM
jgi:hypothetical protein